MSKSFVSKFVRDKTSDERKKERDRQRESERETERYIAGNEVFGRSANALSNALQCCKASRECFQANRSTGDIDDSDAEHSDAVRKRKMSPDGVVNTTPSDGDSVIL
nr:unnamed protein product [Callosobruchus analis]